MSIGTGTGTNAPTQPENPADEAPRPSVGLRAWRASRRFRPVVVLDIVMLVVFALINPGYLSSNNVINLLTSVSIIWLVAIGATFVLLSGGFDLSAGAVAAFSGIAMAKCLNGGLPGWAAIAAAFMVGGLVGAGVDGVLIGKLRLSVFVVTLASMTAFTGLSTLWTSTRTIPVSDTTLSALVIDRFMGLPFVVWLMLLTLGVAFYVQTRTHFGRNVYAVGGSEIAASLSGIRTGRVLIVVYGVAGALAGLGGVIAAGRIGGAAPQVDGTLALQAIAAVLIGGTSLVGGIGGVEGTLFGLLFVAILANGLSVSGVQTYWQQVLTGVILIAAVLGDRLDVASRWRARQGRGTSSSGA